MTAGRLRIGNLRALVAMIALLLHERFAEAQQDSWLRDALPARTLLETGWQAMAFPICERDVIASAKRIGLTREQLIAFEAMLPEYQARANAARRKANAALATNHAPEYRVTKQAPSAAHVAAVKRIRLGFEQELGLLDSALFDRLAPLLDETQRTRMERERLRRERWRLLSDGLMVTWCSRARITVELADVIGRFDLPPDIRAAVDAQVCDFETRLTAKWRELHALVNDSNADWLTQEGEDEQHSWMLMAEDRYAAVAGIIEFEYEWVDRIAKLMPPEIADQWRMAHAREYPTKQVGLSGGHLQAIADSAATLQPDENQELTELVAAVRAQSRKQQHAFPELVKVERLTSSVGNVRLGLGFTGRLVTETNSMQAVYARRNELSQSMFKAYEDARQALKSSLSKPQMDLISAAEARYSMQQNPALGRNSNANRFSNIVESTNQHGSPLVALSTIAPRCERFVVDGITADAEKREMAMAALTGFADRWKAEAQAYHQSAGAALRMWSDRNETFDPVKHAESSEAVVAALRKLEPSVVHASHDLLAVIGDEEVVSEVTAALRWSVAVATPEDYPWPRSETDGLRRRTLMSHLDRADPAAIIWLLKTEPQAIAPAWQVVKEESLAAERRSWRLREAVIRACLLDVRAFRYAMQVTSVPRPAKADYDAMKALQREADDACRAALRLRREHIEQLKAVHARISQALPEECRQQYLERIGAIAFPDAWSGFKRARRMIDQAMATAVGRDDAQQRMGLAWQDRQAALRTQVDEIVALIERYSRADVGITDAARECALIFAELEQRLFEREEEADAVLRLLRPILTDEEMKSVERDAWERPRPLAYG